MSKVRVQHRLAPIVPVRSTISLYRTPTRLPINYRPFAAPRFFPILQPPTFLTRSDFIFEDKEQLQENRRHNYPALISDDYNRKLTRQITVRALPLLTQQNYPTQPLPYSPVRLVRHAEPKYSSHFYSTR